MNLKEILPPTLLVIIGAIFLFLIIYVASNGNKNTDKTNHLDSLAMDSAKMDTTAKAGTKIAETEKPANWSYDTTKDEMTSGSTILASTDATNSFEFNPPYDGYNSASVQVRKHRGVTEIMLKIEKGQFICSVEGCNIKARFDEHRYSEYYCTPASDYDPTVIFIDEPGEFIGNLKRAKKLLIEADIYDNGNQQFEFSVDGFKWGSPKKRKPKFDYGFTIALPKNGKIPPQKKGYITVTGRNRNGHDTVIYIKGYQITPNQ